MPPKLSLPTDRTKTWLTTANVIVVASAFIWYFLAFNLVKENTQSADRLLVYGINIFAIIMSGLVGTIVADKLKKRTTLLYFWILVGILISILPLSINVTDLTSLTAISLVFGLYFGFGMPATMGVHSRLVSTSERGKVSGITLLIIGLVSAAIGLALPRVLIVGCLILVAIRVVGLLFFHYMPKEELPVYNEKSSVRYKAIITNKSFLLYFVPWLMFALINYLAATMINHTYAGQYEVVTAFENVPIAIAAIVSGFIADRWGRKRLTIIGFVILGIGYAILGFSNQGGISQSVGNQIPLGYIVFTITDGVAWGIFYVLFLFTIWGDLANNGHSDKFYLLGALPYVSSYFLRVFFASSLPNTISITLISSFATVFLFLAVLPLIYAPETLPEKYMKDKELKSYIEKAKRIAHKEEENKKQSKQLKVEQNESEEPTQETSEEYKKAKEIAEKYY